MITKLHIIKTFWIVLMLIAISPAVQASPSDTYLSGMHDYIYSIIEEYIITHPTEPNSTVSNTVNTTISYTYQTASCDNSTELNVKCFGAKGDGYSDDTEAIQNAVNALGNSSDVLVFPIGDYSISDTIVFSDSKGKTIKGNGFAWTTSSNPASRIIWNGATLKPIFWFTDGSFGNSIEHLGFYGGSEAILFRPISSGAIKNNFIKYNTFDAQSSASVHVGYPLSDKTSDADFDGYFFEGNKYISSTDIIPKYSVILNIGDNGHRGIFSEESFESKGVSIYAQNWKGISVKNTFFSKPTFPYTTAGNWSVEAVGNGGGYISFENIISESPRLFNGKMQDSIAWGGWVIPTALYLKNVAFNIGPESAGNTAVNYHYGIVAENVGASEKLYLNTSGGYNMTVIDMTGCTGYPVSWHVSNVIYRANNPASSHFSDNNKCGADN